MLKLVRAEAPQILRFAVVGGTGFIVDAAVLTLLYNGLSFDPFSSRIVSMSLATFVTWRLNRAHTFGASDRHQAIEGARYATVAALACAVNYLVYALALILWRALPPFVALVIANVVAIGVSYTGYSRFVFSSARAVLGSSSSQSR